MKLSQILLSMRVPLKNISQFKENTKILLIFDGLDEIQS
jgi:hypothetical protein